MALTYRNVMGTRVNREGSCSSCHERSIANQNGPGRVYCMDARLPNPWVIDPDCAGGPGIDDLTTGAAGSSVASGAAASSSSGGDTQ